MDIKKEFKRDMYHNYMVIMALEENRFEARMIEENEVDGLMKIQVRSIDNEEYYYYDISSKQPIANLFERGQLGYDQIKSIIGGIVAAVEEGSKYLLCEDDYVLDTHYIYITLSSFKVSLCYLPGYNCDIATQFTMVIEYLMDRADHTDEKAVMLVYSLYKTAKQSCNLNSIKDVLDGVDSDVWIKNTGKGIQEDIGLQKNIFAGNDKCENYSFESVKEEEFDSYLTDTLTENGQIDKEGITDCYNKKSLYMTAAVMIVVVMGIVYHFGLIKDSNGEINIVRTVSVLLMLIGTLGIIIYKINERLIAVRNDEAGNNSESEESFFDDNNYVVKSEVENENYDYDDSYEEETVLLADYRKQKELFTLVLKNDTRSECIKVEQVPFIVGKLKDKVDYVIVDDAISRLHAKFDYIDNNQLVVTDLNSKNGTFINGERLLANETRKVNVGDDIGFADLVFNIQ